MTSTKIETSHIFALFFTLILGFFTFINWTNQQYDLISNISPSSQLAQAFITPDPAQNLLIIYNSNSLVPESAELKDFYLVNRPGITNANVLGIDINKTSTQYDNISPFDYISEVDFNTIIRDAVSAWFQSHTDKSIKYIVVMYGVPTRVINNTTYAGSVDNRLNQINGALVTRMDMGTVIATKAYIAKLAAAYTGNLIIYSNNVGNTYYFDDAQGYTQANNGQFAQNAVLGVNPSANIVYSATGDPRTDGVHIRNASDVKGFMTWGANGYLGPDYANNGYFKFSGNSGWYILQTIESWNGQRYTVNSGQSTFLKWFSSDAFGGTNYENTPIGAVVHVEEPGLGGVNSPQYFSLWEQGYPFADTAWGSRVTPFFMAIGDPLVASSKFTPVIVDIPVATINISSPSIISGQSVTITWSSNNANSCLGFGGTFGGIKSISGTEIVTPITNTIYSITCAGPGGISSINSVSLSITIPDTIKPVISNIRSSPIINSVSISWSVNEPVESQVLYGLTTNYESNTSISNLKTQIISGLAPNTLYHYQIKSIDTAGNIATSSDNTFTTQVQPINSTITIASRLNGKILTVSQVGNSCVSNLNSPTGSNTATCSRNIDVTSPGMYSVQWYRGYPIGADIKKIPTITPAQNLINGNLIFYIDFISGATTTLNIIPPNSYSIDITKSGLGTVTSSIGSINCGSACTGTFVSGQSITLTANPDTNSTFTRWTGVDNCSISRVCTFILNDNITVVAIFTEIIPNTPTVLSFTATPNYIKLGQSSAISWYSNNSTSCTGEGVPFNGIKSISGTETVAPTIDTVYTIYCNGSGGTSLPKSIAVMVEPINIVNPPIITETTIPDTLAPVYTPSSIQYQSPVINTKLSKPTPIEKLYRNLKLNDKGEDVLLLQRILNKLGYINTENSIFDKQTADALVKYQESKASTGLIPSGNLDNITLILLNYDIADLSLDVPVQETTIVTASTSQEKSSVGIFITNVFQGFTNFVNWIVSKVL